MITFTARLAYHQTGAGNPLICLPGGPMQDSAYLGDLGGLRAYLQLIMLDPRGTGHSATPEDPSSYRCDRLVDRVRCTVPASRAVRPAWSRSLSVGR